MFASTSGDRSGSTCSPLPTASAAAVAAVRGRAMKPPNRYASAAPSASAVPIIAAAKSWLRLRGASAYDTGTVADTSQPAIFERTVARRMFTPATLVPRNTVFRGTALGQQLGGKRPAHEIFMAFRSGKNDALVIRHAGDPWRVERRGSQEVSKLRGRKGHDEHVGYGVALDHRHLDVEHRPAGDRVFEHIGDLRLLGRKHALGRFRIGGRRQLGAELFRGVDNVLEGAVYERDASFAFLGRRHRTRVKRGEVAAV